MTYQYFSDVELGSKELTSEEIPESVWNAIIVIYNKFVDNCALAGEFPEEDQYNRIHGCNKTTLEDVLKGQIPEISIPIVRHNKKPNKYAILDFLQFLHKNIKDPRNIRISNDWYDHYSFSDNGLFQLQFRNLINELFKRNGIVFFIDTDGQIKRSIPKSIAKIITDISFNTGDERLNELLGIAYSKFVLPRPESRIESLEKIWDAFERIKTYFEKDKNLSANKLISDVSENNSLFSKYITDEFKVLTEIGNKFQIRHFEQDKVKLESNLHIDYLFYRMSCLIHLCVESLKNKQS
jgi:hypothetical protein